jgi:hypothetical protein
LYVRIENSGQLSVPVSFTNILTLHIERLVFSQLSDMHQKNGVETSRPVEEDNEEVMHPSAILASTRDFTTMRQENSSQMALFQSDPALEQKFKFMAFYFLYWLHICMDPDLG